MTPEEAIKWLRRQLYAKRLAEDGICHTLTTFSKETAEKYIEVVKLFGGEMWGEYTEIQRRNWPVGGRPSKFTRTRYKITAWFPAETAMKI